MSEKQLVPPNEAAGAPPEGAGGPPPWANGAGGPPPWANGAGGPPPWANGAGGPPPWANGAGGPPPWAAGAGAPPQAKPEADGKAPSEAQNAAPKKASKKSSKKASEDAPQGAGAPPNGAGGPPPWANGTGGPPPWANGTGGPPPWANGAGGPPPWANGTGGPPPWAAGGAPKGKGAPHLRMPGLREIFGEGGGYIPPEMKAIAPDYTKWRGRLMRMNLNIALAVCFFEAVIFIYFLLHGVIAGAHDVWEYSFKNLILPTILNIIAVSVQYMAARKLGTRDMLQNAMTLFTMTIICTVVSATHYSTMQPMTMFCLPVLTSVVFCSPVLSKITAILNLIGLTICVLIRWLLNIGMEDRYILPEAVVAYTLLVIASLVTRIVNLMINEQRSKLITSIIEAKASQHEALIANNAKSDFLANMSHEIRTPINAILGMNEMILREERNRSIREYASNIKTSGNLLLSIINDVLDISKIESGKVEISSHSYDVSSLISDCYSVAASRARGKEDKLKIKVECDENMPRLLEGDEARIRQITVNLLTNAVKYTEEGKVTFCISGEKTEDGRFMLRVVVRDTGIGISEEDIGSMFTQFKRFDMRRNRNIEGTGLGLTIVKSLLDLMEGTIDVKSTLNVGSEFTVKIPQGIIDETPLGHIELNYSHSSDYEYVQSFEAPDARILAVDDLPMNLMVITNMLKNTKLHIDTANSGAQAIELTEQNKYDVILMDHMMPEMDGIETFKNIRADEKSLCRETPVIMLTANAIAGVREQYMSEGFADYITKPVRGDKLESTIKKFLTPDLVQEASEGGEQEEAALQKDAGPAAALLKELPQLNIKVAMPFCCDSMELFLDILRDYAASTRLEEMKDQFEKEDFENYRINAHSLKSTSLTIGLEALSERARASEFALKVNNTEFVKLNHPDLMGMYEEALGKIREFVKTLPSQ